MYTITASTYNKRDIFSISYLDEDSALDTYNQLLTAVDAAEVVMIDGLTGEVRHLWTKSRGFEILYGNSV